MTEPISPIASSLQALTQRYEAITENLANVSTVGFKRVRTTFRQTLADQTAAIGNDVPSAGIESTNSIDFSQGPLDRTQRDLDLALSGKGFFVLETPQGQLYTRGGSFRLNGQRQLTDSLGRLVAGDSGPIVLPSTTGLSVAVDGTISVEGKSVGKIKLVDFENNADLEGLGSTCSRSKSDQATTTSDAQVHQGHREESNVAAVEELINLITVTRLYQANMRSMQEAEDDRVKSLLQAAMA